MKRLLIIALLLLSFPAQAAFEMETEFKGFTANYWALNTMVIDFPQRRTVVTLALYRDSDSYDADSQNNKLAIFPCEFVISGPTFDQMYDEQQTVGSVLGGVFVYIQSYTGCDAYAEPPFANAEIVP